jgi:thiamine-monophosphate kinase
MLGDDGALLAWTGTGSLVVTTDMLVDGVHFSLGLQSDRPQTTSPFDVGWRSAAANLSDLAAMGADPTGITVCLGLPGTMPVDWVDGIYQGMQACLELSKTPIVGGDICRSPVVTVAIAAFGTVPEPLAIRRSTAQLGDVILVTGVHGASRAGLEILLSPSKGEKLAEGDRQQLIQAHQRPVPRLDVVGQLRQILPPSEISHCRVAGMDSSDGLADAVLQICRASQVGACLERSKIPMPAAFPGWLSPEQAMDWVLYGGEDFELVLCLPEAIAHQLLPRLGTNAAIVGKIIPGSRVIVHGQMGDPWPTSELMPDTILSMEQGFQHFGG